jgi:hypothetical protein
MKQRVLLASWIILLAALITAASGASVSAEQNKTRLAVVVAQNSPLEELSIHDLKHLYMGDQILGPGGKKLIPIAMRPGSSERSAFEQAVLGMNPERIASYWIDRKIRGQSGPPTSVDTADVLRRVVSKLDGGIGYVPEGEVRDFLKVVRIDGKGPADLGYRVEF